MAVPPAPASTRRALSPARASLLFAGAGVALAVALDLLITRTGEPATATKFIGRFHPLAVHLPIGIIVLVGVLEGLAFVPKWRARVDPVLSMILPLAFASALGAFALGLVLAKSGGQPAHLLRMHERLTLAMIVTLAASLVAWSVYQARDGSRLPYRVALLATVSLLSLGAHFGGSMTHGEDYLLEYAPAFVQAAMGDGATAERPDPADANDADADADAANVDADAAPSALLPDASASAAPDAAAEPDASATPDASTTSPPTASHAATARAPAAPPPTYSADVAPILANKCGKCHGAAKQKGKLRLDSLAAVFAGGKEGPAVVAGNAAGSAMIKRFHLPKDDDDHMPPENEAQLTAREIRVLTSWIASGAK